MTVAATQCHGHRDQYQGTNSNPFGRILPQIFRNSGGEIVERPHALGSRVAHPRRDLN
jgi:hypothetical protein